MDARRAPRRILSFHAADQVSDFFGYLRPPPSLPAGSPLPDQAVSSAMPSNHRCGLDENECFGPVGPDLTNEHPEQAIESLQLGVWLLALVHGKLLSKSDRLQCQTVPRDQKRPQVRQHREHSPPHGSMLIACA